MQTNKVLAIAHRKGGVGKTTTVVHLATGLAGLGVPVVAIDLDPQGNLGQFLGLSPTGDVYDLLMARRPERLLAETLTSVPNYPRLRVILGNDETKAAERALGAPESRHSLTDALQRVITSIASLAGRNGRAPYILLDTPPGLGSLQMAALTIADCLIIPVNPSFASETGLPKLAEGIQLIRQKSGRGAKLIGILPTRYKSRTLEHQAVLKGLAQNFGQQVMYPAIRDTVRLEESPGQGRPVWAYDPNRGGAQDYIRVFRRVVQDMDIHVNASASGRR